MSYRDDQDALHSQVETLTRDLDRNALKLEQSTAEMAELQQRLDSTEKHNTALTKRNEELEHKLGLRRRERRPVIKLVLVSLIAVVVATVAVAVLYVVKAQRPEVPSVVSVSTAQEPEPAVPHPEALEAEPPSPTTSGDESVTVIVDSEKVQPAAPSTSPLETAPSLADQQKARDLIQKASGRYIATDYEVAIKLARQALEVAPDSSMAIQIIGASACYLKKAGLISWAYKQLLPRKRQLLRQVCQRNNVNIQ